MQNVLNKFTSDYKVIELEDRDDMDAIQDYLRDITGARSVRSCYFVSCKRRVLSTPLQVPRVFVNGKCIGGSDETAKAAGDGSLQKMLA